MSDREEARRRGCVRSRCSRRAEGSKLDPRVVRAIVDGHCRAFENLRRGASLCSLLALLAALWIIIPRQTTSVVMSRIVEAKSEWVTISGRLTLASAVLAGTALLLKTLYA